MYPLTRTTYRERLRLLRPCKPRAPTEYNEAYKKWALVFPTKRVSEVKKKTRPTKKRSNVDNMSVYSGSTGYPASTCTGGYTDKASSVDISSPTPFPLPDERFEHYDMGAVLKTMSVPLNIRSHPKNVRPGTPEKKQGKLHVAINQLESEDAFSHKLRHLNHAISKAGANFPKCYANKMYPATKHRREAWGRGPLTSNEGPRKPPGKNFLDRTETIDREGNPIKMGDLCKEINRMDQWTPSENDQASSKGVDENPPSREGVHKVRSESAICVTPYNETSSDVHAEPAKKVRRPQTAVQKRRDPYSSEGVGRDDVKNLYQNLSPEDIKRLKESYKKLVGKSSDKNKTPSKSQAGKFDSKSHVNYPYLCRTGRDWNTSYTRDYRHWPGVHENCYKECSYPRSEGETAHTEKLTTTSTPKKHDQEIKEKQKSEAEQYYKQSEGRKLTFESQEKLALAAKERDRIIDEADKIMEVEFRNTIGQDGKAKMENYRSSDAYKRWNAIKKPDVPIWADKHVKSLGSGHWNLPHNTHDAWNLTQERAAGDEDFKPSDRIKPAFKLKDGHPTAEKRPTIPDADDPLKQADPFISLYYPDIRTNSSFLSEYMRQYHAVPLPSKHNTRPTIIPWL